MIIAEWIKEQRKLLEAATPRPWYGAAKVIVAEDEYGSEFEIPDTTDDVKLIAQAPTSLEKALAIIEIYEEAMSKQINLGCNCSNENGEFQTKGPTHFCYLHTARAKAAQIVGGEG